MIEIFLQIASSTLGIDSDVSVVTYFVPIFAFLLVFVIMFALISKTKLLESSHFFELFASFFIASIFVTIGSIRQHVLSVIPWIAIFLVSLFLVLLLIGILIKDMPVIADKRFGWFFIILLILVFLISGIKVFVAVLGPYLPESSFDVISSRIVGAIVLLAMSGIASFVLAKYLRR